MSVYYIIRIIGDWCFWWNECFCLFWKILYIKYLVLLLCNGMFFVNASLDTIYFEQEKVCFKRQKNNSKKCFFSVDLKWARLKGDACPLEFFSWNALTWTVLDVTLCFSISFVSNWRIFFYIFVNQKNKWCEAVPLMLFL